jgi:hypothetical protein
MRLAVILCLLLSACTANRGQVVTGDEVLAPGGFYMLCAEQPGPECGNLKDLDACGNPKSAAVKCETIVPSSGVCTTSATGMVCK